ncbi:MAG: hypothetical protein RIN56_03090 [Sporomusaceae bacterium]|nr:hypothetical protein [Sporomusaceae bacterium]
MKFIEFYGDSRLRHKIVYDKESYSECIYCGTKADSREHIPSKVFLERPYPENLAIVPACSTCNNSFSKDELFLSILVEKLKIKYYDKGYIPSMEIITRINNNTKISNEIDNAVEADRINQFEKRISRILFKLAIGHAVYEISEGYCIKDINVDYSFLPDMTNQELDEFCQPYILNGELYPEVGSRVYDRIMVLEFDLVSNNEAKEKYKAQVLILDWVDVQQSKYSYTGYRFGNEIEVKMIINDFLYSKVVINVDK